MTSKLPTILTLATLAALPFAAGTAHADEPAACADGYVAAGPYCVNPIYIDNPLFVDPATCEFGYFQGNCVPDTLRPAPEHPVADYTYQPAPIAAPVVAAVAVKAAPVWLTQIEVLLGDLRSAR